MARLVVGRRAGFDARLGLEVRPNGLREIVGGLMRLVVRRAGLRQVRFVAIERGRQFSERRRYLLGRLFEVLRPVRQQSHRLEVQRVRARKT